MASTGPKSLTPVTDSVAPGRGGLSSDVEGGDDGPPLSFADIGIPTGPQLQDTVTGKIRRFDDISKKEIAYLIITGIALLATIVFTIYKLATVDKKEPDFVFAIVIVVNVAFCTFYLVHGMLKERPYEIFILIAATIIILIYLAVNFGISNNKGTIKLIRLVIAGVVGPVTVILGILIGREYLSSGRLVFRTVGASTELQSSCKLMYFFLDLIKLDLQLGITMVILILTNGANVNTLDIVVLTVGIAITIGWFLLGHLALRFESKVMTFLFWGLSPAELAYIIYKTIKASGRLHIAKALAACSISAGVLAAVTRVAVIIVTYFVYRNYGKGLKEKAFDIN